MNCYPIVVLIYPEHYMYCNLQFPIDFLNICKNTEIILYYPISLKSYCWLESGNIVYFAACVCVCARGNWTLSLRVESEKNNTKTTLSVSWYLKVTNACCRRRLTRVITEYIAAIDQWPVLCETLWWHSMTRLLLLQWTILSWQYTPTNESHP